MIINYSLFLFVFRGAKVEIILLITNYLMKLILIICLAVQNAGTDFTGPPPRCKDAWYP